MEGFEEREVESAGEVCRRLAGNVHRVVFTDPGLVRTVVACFIAGGHLLIEGPPGVGKTILARAVARSTDGVFTRLQFTNDLMPADVLGTSVFLRDRGTFEFKKGPVFANVFLADEINRANPRTQSALMEAMNEGRVSVDAGTFELPSPFFVLATENPVEFEGTYPLPEAQVDRFLVRVCMGYPAEEKEKLLYRHGSTEEDVERLRPVLDGDRMRAVQDLCGRVAVEDSLVEYVYEVVSRTRMHPDVVLGVSPRGALLWLRTARAWALMDGRAYVVPDDLKDTAVACLAHRVSLTGSYDTHETSHAQEELVRDILGGTPVPL